MEFPHLPLPLGFRFLPKPSECIYYLTCKVSGNPLPCDGIFLDLDPYDVKQLPDIFSSVDKSDELYLFTKLHRKGRIGNINANRRVGMGTWHGDQTIKVKDDHGTQVGIAQKFSYREKGSNHDHKFLMTEYALLKGTSLQYDSLKDYVLCHIVKKGRGQNGKRVYKSKSEVVVAGATPISSPVENPSTSSSMMFTNSIYSYQVETSTHVQPFVTPSFSPQEHHDDFHEFYKLGDKTVDVAAAESVPSTSIATHNDALPLATTSESQLIYSECSDCFQAFGSPLFVPQDDLHDVLMMFDTEVPSLDSYLDNLF